MLTLDCVAPEALWLHRHIREVSSRPAGSDRGPPVPLDIGRAAEASPDHWLHPAARRRRAVVALGKIVRRIGKAAFPTLDAAITPNVFRHAVATDMRASGRFEPDEIARAFGHLGIRSQSRYGTRGPGRPGRRAEALLEVEAPRQPRPRRDATRHGQGRRPP
ncbi:site-specific integrase [Histidinibacterium lentulum]|uniref:Site-specific integrase n=2 Tax=Histidinibacterium lentulum TaxID=2480588 RepID=A0A3N2QSC9_9RHOB|nr:site-specific integrase [Histidinibacterium lentulum]